MINAYEIHNWVAPFISIIGIIHHLLIDTPWKINMEPSNHPFRKENDLNQTSMRTCSMLIFRGCVIILNGIIISLGTPTTHGKMKVLHSTQLYGDYNEPLQGSPLNNRKKEKKREISQSPDL